MSTEDFNVAELFIEFSSLIIALVSFFGGSAAGVYVQYKLNVVTKIKNRIHSDNGIRASSVFGNVQVTVPPEKGTHRALADVQQDIVRKPTESPLSPKQEQLCVQITNITSTHLSECFNPRDLYVTAIRCKNSQGYLLAVTEYLKLFTPILTKLRTLASERGADTQVNNLSMVIASLKELLSQQSDEEKIKRQIASCELALELLLLELL